MQALEGVGVAMITPFTPSGSIDYPALERLVMGYCETIDYLVVLGTTAETATLSKTEKQEVLRFVAKINAGRLPLVVGIGGNNTAAVVEELVTTELEGYSAILSVCPYYNRPNQEGIYHHYSALAKATPLPLILYNVPSRTASTIENTTCLRLQKDFDVIIGIKDARGDMAQAVDLIAKSSTDFMVISGDDHTALDLVSNGGKGVISVIAGAYPSYFTRLIHNGMNQALPEAVNQLQSLLPLIDLLFEEGNPTGLKALLHAQGHCQNILRLPLVPASAHLYTRIEAAHGRMNARVNPVK